MSRDWLFVENDHICDVRAVGVLIRDGKLLVQRDRDGHEFALPGGHIHIGETLEEGLCREYREETGVDITCVRMLWSEECFWEWGGKKTHNLSFYYLIVLKDDALLPDTEDFTAHRDNNSVLYGWLPVDKLQEVTIYPAFIKTEIAHLDGPIRHFVTRE